MELPDLRRTEPRPYRTRPQHIGVIGGGILGMFLALKLSAAGAKVTILEAAPTTGGLAGPAGIGGYSWDRFYHVILMSDQHTRSLLDELGMSDQLRWGVTRTGFYTDGQLHSLSNSVEFLGFPALSLVDKLRLGGTIFLASRIKDWHPLEQTLAVDWLTRWSGRSVVDRIWLPLLKSKLGANCQIASAAFIWAIIARMYAARRSGLKREMFGYVAGGYDLVLRRLQKRLDEVAVRTLFNAPAKEITDYGDKVTVSLGGDGRVETFDALVATVPTGLIAKMCPQLTEQERARLDGVVYQGIICPSLLLKKPLSSFYVTNITDRWVPFTGVIEMTSLVNRETFGGHSLVYLPWYLTQDDSAWSAPDDRVLDESLGALERMYPEFARTDIVASQVSRARNVLAVSTLGYSERHCPPLTTSLPNVFVINSAQITAGTLNVNDTLGLVHGKLPELLQRLAQKAS